MMRGKANQALKSLDFRTGLVYTAANLSFSCIQTCAIQIICGRWTNPSLAVTFS